MITIKDIAREAGVSVTTVSRALNDYFDVSASTKAHILKVAKDLGYVPNKMAQNLVKQQNNTLAIILSGLEKEGGKDNIVYSLLSGMYAFAETVNYEVALFTTSSAHQKEKSYVQFCREHNIGGAVVNGIRTDDSFFKELLHSDLPCVLIDVPMEGKNTSTISVDNVEASTGAVEHLIQNNHKRIGMVNGRKEAAVSLEREKGYRHALNKSRILVDDRYIVYADYQEDIAYEKTKELLQACPEITALFCASDMMAIGAMRAIRDMGRSVPEDISIVGFDNIPLSAHTSPALTTINQDFYMMGHEASRQLLKMIKNEPVKRNVFLDYKLLERKSVRMI